MTRILLISGSTHEGSVQTAALRVAARSAPADVTAVRYEGLRDLPAFVPGQRDVGAAVQHLRDEVTAADAVLFCTPEYAGSLPGSLKNLLDWLVAGGELGAKPTAWLSVTIPGHDEGARAALESALGHANARLLKACTMRIPLSQAAVDADGLIVDPTLHTALQDLLHSIARVLSFKEQRERPSWQAYSSVYPVVQRTESPYNKGPFIAGQDRFRPPS